MNDILSLKTEVKQLQTMAQQLEPFVKSFSAGVNAGEINTAASDAAGHQHLQALLDHLSRLQMQEPPQPQTPAPTKDFRQSRSNIPSADNAYKGTTFRFIFDLEYFIFLLTIYTC